MTDAQRIAELERQLRELTQRISMREWIATGVAVLSFLFTVFVWWRSNRASANAMAVAQGANTLAERANSISESANALSTKSNTLAEQANLLAAGQAEMGLLTVIDEAWDKVEQLQVELRGIIRGRPVSELNRAEQRLVESSDTTLRSRLQGWLNKYEAACSQYRDKKLDPERFRKYFYRKIREVMETENEDIRAVLQLGPTTPYKALTAVYQEFHDQGV